MSLLAYHRDDPIDRPSRDLQQLVGFQRWTAIAALANAAAPWTIGVALATGVDFLLQPAAAGRHARLRWPGDAVAVLVLSTVLTALAIGSVWSGRLIGRRRWAAASIAVAVVQLAYVPFGTVAGVRTLRLLLFRPDIRDLYRSDRPETP